MIIDSHVHVYPEKIAVKAADSVAGFYTFHEKLQCACPETLLAVREKSDVSMFLIHSVATTSGQVCHINDFIASCVQEHPEAFIGFATMHPDFREQEAELSRCMAMGLKGVKLHPDFQKFPITDPRMYECYGFCEKNGLPVLFHTGDPRYAWSNPHYVPELLELFPSLKIIAAHMGGYREWEDALRYVLPTNAMVDCSSTGYYIGADALKKLIDAFGPDRVLFGSDFPMFDPADCLGDFRALGFDEETERKITGENLVKYLGL